MPPPLFKTPFGHPVTEKPRRSLRDTGNARRQLAQFFLAAVQQGRETDFYVPGLLSNLENCIAVAEEILHETP